MIGQLREGVDVAHLTIGYSLFVNLWTELMKTCAGSNPEVVLALLANVGDELIINGVR